MQFTKRQELVTRRIAGETVIIPVKGGIGDLNSIYTLNETGTLLWESLSAGMPVGELVGTVCREYDVTEAAAEKDIAEFLESLRAEDLICASQVDGG